MFLYNLLIFKPSICKRWTGLSRDIEDEGNGTQDPFNEHISLVKCDSLNWKIAYDKKMLSKQRILMRHFVKKYLY